MPFGGIFFVTNIVTGKAVQRVSCVLIIWSYFMCVSVCGGVRISQTCVRTYCVNGRYDLKFYKNERGIY